MLERTVILWNSISSINPIENSIRMAIIKKQNYQDRLYNTGNYIHYLVIAE